MLREFKNAIENCLINEEMGSNFFQIEKGLKILQPSFKL